MPFKTRAQKSAAAKRRFSFDSLGKVTYDKSSHKAPLDKKLEKATPISSKKVKAKDIEDLSYLRPDIFKILVSSLIIVAAQAALSLTLR